MISPWRDLIPEDWEEAPFKHLTKTVTGGTPNRSETSFWDGSIPWVSSKDMKKRELADTEEKITQKAIEEGETTLVPKGSLLMVSRSGILEHSIPVAVATRELAINQDIRAYIPDGDIRSRYLRYLFMGFEDDLLQLWKQQGATVQSLNSVAVSETRIPVPSMEKQNSIISYCEMKVKNIDELIQKCKKLDALLESRKQALTHNLITRYEYENEVKLKYITDMLPGYAFPSEGFSDSIEHIKLLRGINVGIGETKWGETEYWGGNSKEYSEYLLEPGDIVLAMDRPWINGGIRIAQLAESDCPALLVQRVLRIRTGEEALQEYVRIVLGSDRFKQYFDPILTGVSVPHISKEQVGNFSIPLPSIEEQRSVVSDWKNFRSKKEEIEKRNQELIELLREKRQALVTAAVTGQIDMSKEKGVIQGDD